MCAVRRTCRPAAAGRRRRNSKRSWIIAVIVLADPISALAHLQLGRAYVIAGDMAKARNAYQDFLALWKDADEDIPVFRQANAEYANQFPAPIVITSGKEA
jgi:hypothetical protein